MRMRLLLIFFLAASGGAILLLLKPGADKSAKPDGSGPIDISRAQPARPPAPALPPSAPLESAPAPPLRPADTRQATPPSEPDPESEFEISQARIARLFEAAADGSPVQLDFVYAELRSAEAALREAALDAIVQFVGRDAVPRLKQIAEATEDAREKARLLEAIEFLELPTLSERRAAREAAGQNPPKPLNQGARQRKALQQP